MVSGERGNGRKEDRNTQKEEADVMNEETPFYKNGELNVGSNLKYGLDLEGGSWLQLQLQGAIAQVTADQGKIIQGEFTRLLNDPTIKIEETTLNSITFTTSKQTTQKTID